MDNLPAKRLSEGLPKLEWTEHTWETNYHPSTDYIINLRL